MTFPGILKKLFANEGAGPLLRADIIPAAEAGSVSGDTLADGAVTTGKLEDSAVTESKVADGAITSGKISSGAVGSEQIADGSIKASDLDPAIQDAISQVTSGAFLAKAGDTATGAIYAPTAAAGSSDTQVATTAFVTSAIATALASGVGSVTTSGSFSAITVGKLLICVGTGASSTKYSIGTVNLPAAYASANYAVLFCTGRSATYSSNGDTDFEARCTGRAAASFTFAPSWYLETKSSGDSDWTVANTRSTSATTWVTIGLAA